MVSFYLDNSTTFFLKNNSTFFGATLEMLEYDQDRYSHYAFDLNSGGLRVTSMWGNCSDISLYISRKISCFKYAACLLLDNIPLIGRLLQLFRERVLGIVLITSPTPSATPSATTQVKVMQPDGTDFTIDVSGTVADLKAAIAQRNSTPIFQIMLYVAGQEELLSDTLSVAECTNVFMLLETDPQKNVLAKLFYTCGGENWHRKDGWITNPDISQWHGVGLDSENRVISLDFQSNNLVGQIPPELGTLTNLEILWITGSSLSGPIPPELGSLTRLKSCFLNSNKLTGTVPESFNELTGSLRRLSLAGNRHLRGTIPSPLKNYLLEYTIGREYYPLH